MVKVLTAFHFYSEWHLCKRIIIDEDYYYATTIPSLISDMSKLSHSLYNLFITCGGEGRGGGEIGQQHTFIPNLLTTSPLLYCVSCLKHKNNVNINNDSTLT